MCCKAMPVASLGYQFSTNGGLKPTKSGLLGPNGQRLCGPQFYSPCGAVARPGITKFHIGSGLLPGMGQETKRRIEARAAAAG